MAEEEARVRLQVHHSRFFNRQPQAIHCIAPNPNGTRVAVSRTDGSVEIFNAKDNWIQEVVFPGGLSASIEALCWAGGQLYAAGLAGNVTRLCLQDMEPKESVSSNAGAIWCLTANDAQDTLAAGTEDGCVVVFSLDDGLTYLRGFGKQEGRILCVAWHSSGEGNTVLVTGGLGNLRQWSLKSGQPLSRMAVGKYQGKDTIVWAVQVTSEFIIISGDSRGIVTFWNGKESTQIKTFHCHKADVLSLCLSQDGDAVFSSGVDGNLYQFNQLAAAPGNPRTRWAQQLLHSRHTHDVRALAFTHGYLVSGGVDCVLRVARLSGKQKGVWDVDPFPQTPLVGCAGDRGLLMLQYPSYLEVWRLGQAQAPFAKTRGLLPLTRRPLKLLQLRARPADGEEEGAVIAAALAPNGNTLAFSDSRATRMYTLSITGEDSPTPSVAVSKLPCRLSRPARLMAFANGGQLLVAVLAGGRAEIVKVEKGISQHTVNHSAEHPIQRLCGHPTDPVFAAASTDRKVTVYSTDTGQPLCQCPSPAAQPSCLAFSPHKPTLAFADAHNTVCEFDYSKGSLAEWSRRAGKKLNRSWLGRYPVTQVRGISFPPEQPGHLAVHSFSTLALLDTDKMLKTDSEHKEYLRKCHKYKYLVSCDYLPSGELAVVEIPPVAIQEQLPPSLKQKKFGLS